MMIQRELILFGATDKDSNPLLCLDELSDFLKEFPNKSIVFTVSILEGKDHPAMMGFYYKYVVPRVQRGYYNNGYPYNEKEAEYEIRLISPITNRYTFNGKEYVQELLRFNDLSTPEAVEHIDFIKQWVAENLQTFIDDTVNLSREA